MLARGKGRRHGGGCRFRGAANGAAGSRRRVAWTVVALRSAQQLRQPHLEWSL